MPEGSRPDRVSEEFREILAEEIPKLKDPRVGFVTVLGVTVTPDLRLARVFYTTLGDDRAHRATAANAVWNRACYRAGMFLAAGRSCCAPGDGRGREP